MQVGKVLCFLVTFFFRDTFTFPEKSYISKRLCVLREACSSSGVQMRGVLPADAFHVSYSQIWMVKWPGDTEERVEVEVVREKDTAPCYHWVDC